jgi:hypothetical protein
MFARLAKFSDARRWHPMPVQATHAHCNDNHRPDPRVAATSQRAKRQTLVCRWHPVPATARIECHWQIGSLDETSAEPVGGRLDEKTDALAARPAIYLSGSLVMRRVQNGRAA